MKIMIVEDDSIIRDLLAESLVKWNFEVVKVTDFSRVLELFMIEKPNLILLDITLPVFDGYYWCQKIREINNTPIIFISSRNTNMDTIMSMQLGGDDYVNKPFSMDVLIAKINALLRRTYDYDQDKSITIEHRGLTLNLENNTITLKNNICELSKNESQLLAILLKNKGKVASREKLLRSLWDDERFVDDNTLTVNINRLRKKIDSIGHPDYIETRVGQGYIIQ
ncbi:DNA-binding response regulator [Vagococcus penaei]|uniref:DNA-binding response regulator n=1 Tax=Vagococcus penaei TaxID=633807 RepID=A0A1Q2D766_9ENTE|nr:response regulator transcription factor [Vagococcus penaei]AQP54266.1 DNA-binding response regulator [Vagococcus penaei]RSU05847.1 DNA-binding response regulator [Vagococcus penaei]